MAEHSASTPDIGHFDATRVQAFVQFLRQQDFSCGPGQLLDAERVAAAGYLHQRDLLRRAYRPLFCRNHADWLRFNECFDAFWQRPQPSVERPGDANLIDGMSSDATTASGRMVGFAGTSSDRQTADLSGAGDFRALSLADFRFVFDPRQKRQLELMVDALARRMRRRFQRRQRPAQKPGAIDVRHSLQRSLRCQGRLADLCYRQRRRRLPRFILLLDISQSMEVYSKLFLRFARELLAVFEQAEAFAFNIALIPIGDGRHVRSEAQFEQHLNRVTKGWLGGTRIAESLAAFNTEYRSQLVNSRTTVVIFSDGCDTAPPEALGREVDTLRRHARRLIWVNPLLGRFQPGEPDRYMDPIVPYVHRYRSAHNLASLLALERDLLY